MMYEDYIDTQRSYVRELKKLLTRFARNIGSSAPLVEPFVDDISTTKQQILDKPWDEKTKREICRTPGMLMINVDFDEFDPQNDPWLYFYFGNRYRCGADKRVFNSFKKAHEESVDGLHIVDEVLQKLTNIIRKDDCDIFNEVRKLYKKPIDALSVFEVKPGVFGFSIDIIKGYQVIRNTYENIRVKRKK